MMRGERIVFMNFIRTEFKFIRVRDVSSDNFK